MTLFDTLSTGAFAARWMVWYYQIGQCAWPRVLPFSHAVVGQRLKVLCLLNGHVHTFYRTCTHNHNNNIKLISYRPNHDFKPWTNDQISEWNIKDFAVYKKVNYFYSYFPGKIRLISAISDVPNSIIDHDSMSK